MEFLIVGAVISSISMVLGFIAGAFTAGDSRKEMDKK